MTFSVGNLNQYTVAHGSRRYDSSSGVVARIHAVAIIAPAPPVTTETTAPSQLATSPASSSPSCGPPMKNTMLTPIIRPRRWSGVSIWRITFRNTMLTVSLAPVSASATNETQNIRDTPNATVASPYIMTAPPSQRPRHSIASTARTMTALVRIAPAAGAAYSQP